MLKRAKTYQELIQNFSWDIPDSFNIGHAVCDFWAEQDASREALVFIDENDQTHRFTYGDLRKLSNQLANLFEELKAARGDRIGVLLPQRPETAYAHIAAFKIGAISVPLFTLFGEEALEFRLQNAGIKIVITDQDGARKLNELRQKLPDLKHVLCVDCAVEGAANLNTLLAKQSETFKTVDTSSEDPALIIYTSGTTGQPKGALHAHRVLLGHLPGVEMSHDFLGQEGDRIWTPADWAWIGGLLDVLLPALYLGVPVVARRFKKFTAEAAFDLLETHKIRNAFLPPTALKMMRQLERPQDRWTLNLRSIASDGETLGAELINWGRETFDLTINEFYGQTECNMVVSSCQQIMPAQPAIMGRSAPGHQVAIVNDTGEELEAGKLGNIAVKRPDPVMFLNYWQNDKATQDKFAGDWLLTGDTGLIDEEGWIRFVGRDDDVITSSGYRIGPGEIEDCLIRHPAVAMAGVIGKPDKQRTEIVKAFVVLKSGIKPSNHLAQEISNYVKMKLAAHEYPREVEFVDTLPMTTTGKVIRKELRARET